ncbi:hypothetical protein JCM14076_27230 [Methylosoma difficile]
MTNKIKTLGLLTATVAVAGVLVAPQSFAKSKAVRSNYSEVAAMNSKVQALEAQLQSMQYELQALRAEASRPAPVVAGESAKVQELEQWMHSVKAKPVSSQDKNDSMVFFRGGFAYNDQVRNDILTGNQVAGGALGGGIASQDGWYTGAGFDFGLTDDVWGMVDSTEVMAELMFEYKNFGSKKFSANNNPLCTTVNAAAGAGAAGTASCDQVTVTQFTLTAAPKIKFMKGSAFRPWIIPVGMGIHVISPPSNGVTVLNPGAMFAAGAEYAIWKEIKVGMDARYHWTGYDSDGVNTNGLTAGGYLGIGF